MWFVTPLLPSRARLYLVYNLYQSIFGLESSHHMQFCNQVKTYLPAIISGLFLFRLLFRSSSNRDALCPLTSNLTLTDLSCPPWLLMQSFRWGVSQSQSTIMRHGPDGVTKFPSKTERYFQIQASYKIHIWLHDARIIHKASQPRGWVEFRVDSPAFWEVCRAWVTVLQAPAKPFWRLLLSIPGDDVTRLQRAL